MIYKEKLLDFLYMKNKVLKNILNINSFTKLRRKALGFSRRDIRQ
jgi:hypothetical protein